MRKGNKKSRMTLACQSAEKYNVRTILPQNIDNTN